MTHHSPEPLVPPEVDVRDVALPLAAFVELAMQTFGMDRETAERLVRSAAAHLDMPVQEVGHA